MLSTNVLIVAAPNGGRADAKLGAGIALQQLLDRQPGIEEIGDVAGLRNLLEQAPANRSLTSSDLAGQQDKTAVAADAVEQMRERLLVAFAHVQVAWIGREGEGRFAEAEIIEIT